MNQKDEGTQDDRARDGGNNFIGNYQIPEALKGELQDIIHQMLCEQIFRP